MWDIEAIWAYSTLRRFARPKASCFAGIQKLMRVNTTEDLDQLRDDAGPSGLMAGPQARTVIAVEIFVEQYVVPPQRIGLELLRASVNRPPAGFVPQEYPFQTIGYFVGDLEQVHQLAGAGGALDLEVVAVIQVELRSEEHT